MHKHSLGILENLRRRCLFSRTGAFTNAKGRYKADNRSSLRITGRKSTSAFPGLSRLTRGANGRVELRLIVSHSEVCRAWHTGVTGARVRPESLTYSAGRRLNRFVERIQSGPGRNSDLWLGVVRGDRLQKRFQFAGKLLTVVSIKT